jgi:hypothetical protein
VYWQPLLSACMSFGDLLFHNGINHISRSQSSSWPSSPSNASCKRLEPSGVAQRLCLSRTPCKTADMIDPTVRLRKRIFHLDDDDMARMVNNNIEHKKKNQYNLEP